MRGSLFFYMSGFSLTSIHDSQDSLKGEAISSTRYYHFQPLNRYLDISQAISYDRDFNFSNRQQPGSNRQTLFSERKSLITKLDPAWFTESYTTKCDFINLSQVN